MVPADNQDFDFLLFFFFSKYLTSSSCDNMPVLRYLAKPQPTLFFDKSHFRLASLSFAAYSLLDCSSPNQIETSGQCWGTALQATTYYAGIPYVYYFTSQLPQFQSHSLLMAWQKTAKVHGPHPPMQETHTKLLIPGFSLALPWLLWPLGSEPADGRDLFICSFFPCLSTSLSFRQIHKSTIRKYKNT